MKAKYYIENTVRYKI